MINEKSNKNEFVKLEENKSSIVNMIFNSIEEYKNKFLIRGVNETYGSMLQKLSQDKINSIESITKKIVKKDEIARCLELLLNYLGLEYSIRYFADLQKHIHHILHKEGISDQQLIDILYLLTGEDIFMSLAMKNELNNAFYKLNLLTNEEMRAKQKEQIMNNLYNISLN